MKNWTMAEAIQTIVEGKDVEGMKEIGKYFQIGRAHV